MGILSRFKDIMASNVNALLDKCEDPSKMVDQTLRDLNESLADVKKETAIVMADAERAKRERDNCKDKVAELEACAKKALVAGNEGDAKELLSEKVNLSNKLTGLESTCVVAQANADKMRQMHDKLVKDIKEMESRRDVIKSKLATAKAQQHMNEITGSADTSGSINAFAKWEAKADKALDAANAEAELNAGSGDQVKDLTEKYQSGTGAVDEELARMKAEMGL